MKYWTPEQDRVLFSLTETNPTASYDQVALMFTEKTGIPTTGDAARKRLKRVRQSIEINEKARVVPHRDDPFVLTPVPKEEFVGFRPAFFDIETTGLTAIIGRMLVASIADAWGNVTTKTILDLPGETVIDDINLALWLRDELKKYDFLVTWNGKMYDVPMLNARLMRRGHEPLMNMMHIDPMYKARAGTNGLRIGSSKLDNVAKFFNTPNQKTPIDWDTWSLAGTGDPVAMATIVEHCEADTLVLRDVFNHLKPLIQSVHR